MAFLWVPLTDSSGFMSWKTDVSCLSTPGPPTSHQSVKWYCEQPLQLALTTTLALAAVLPPAGTSRLTGGRTEVLFAAQSFREVFPPGVDPALSGG